MVEEGIPSREVTKDGRRKKKVNVPSYSEKPLPPMSFIHPNLDMRNSANHSHHTNTHTHRGTHLLNKCPEHLL